MYNNCNLLGNIEQEAVAYRLATPFTDINVMHSGEEVWIKSFDGQAPRVIIKVVKPTLKLIRPL